MKAYSVKQEFEKQDELKRSALRAVSALTKIPDAGNVINIPFICISLISFINIRFQLVQRCQVSYEIKMKVAH